MKVKQKHSILFFILIIITFSILPLKTLCQVGGGTVNQIKQNATSFYYDQLLHLTNFISSEISTKASFCIVDPVTDWNKSFNYSSDLGFLSSCMLKQGDVSQRLCTAAETRFYLDNYLMYRSGNYLKPNRNCNLKSWASGCEPGWACSSGLGSEVNLKNSTQIPARNADCQPCCAGFFCPRGLTCMIPCPLGSYCPSATFSVTAGLCEPYSYQKPAGQPNHTCGAANIWATLGISEEIFCPAGSYCPSNTQKLPCSDGHYCRTGSTTQTRCSKMISCKSNTENQNIHTYGVMFLTTLSALLLVIYSCSDQILTIRERRRAKSREKAARILKESELNRLRWLGALDANKHMKNSHSNSSQVHDEDVIVIDASILEANDSSSPSINSSNSEAFQLSSQESGSESNVQPSHGSSDQTPESEDKTRRRLPKGRNTNTKIFKYAYAEMEKEKHQERQNQNLFSRVAAMTMNPDIQKRPPIEICFKDLTLQLKGKQKYLLRHVTGKITPGCITAVMGPSGAGKTTLLSALAGKVRGCIGRGAILVNGEPVSIHSYKKIIGFVPQDDIVHGNLTVEENLFFSANCRLSADLPKAEKVLIIERVLENLGLQEVRDSIVGTVEKRGISGGQRKRVNVGLEMVMEPSLLFLDEPTSGLDSSSSLLLLKALKREALVGVNICMVVHQPSYALFKMFDDLILLAKGGLVVYHGPIKNVEDYFGGFGIDVPDRVNPPDYYIDILEGVIEPCKDSAVNYKELPVAWMFYNGYPVPQDMQSVAAGLTNSTSDRSNGVDEEGSAEFRGEQWRNIESDVALEKDSMYQTLLWRKDLSNRRTPCKILQYKYFLGRIIKQRLREARLQATDYLIILIAAICVGSITNIGDADFGAFGYSYTIIAMSLLCQIAALRTYSLDKLQFRRERASGMSSLAHFLAKDTVDHFNTLVKPALYLSMFYFFTNPRSTFLDNYIVLVCLVYCVTGMGYLFAILLNPGPAQLFSVLLPVCLTLITTQSLNNDSLKTISNLCFPKWALEALVIANARRYYGVWIITRCLALYKYKYSLHAWKLCLLILILFGAVSRSLAFIALLVVQRK